MRLSRRRLILKTLKFSEKEKLLSVLQSYHKCVRPPVQLRTLATVSESAPLVCSL